MSHDAPSLDTDDLRDVLIRSGNSYVELHARSGADGRFTPIVLKKSISEGSRFLRKGLVRSLGNYMGDLVIGSLFNERPF